MPITKKQAKLLGLRVVRLLEYDILLGHARRPKKHEPQKNIVYSLDEFEIHTKVVSKTHKRKPDDVVFEDGIPLRPLYYDEKVGRILRAFPISWREGVPYYDYRDAVEKET